MSFEIDALNWDFQKMQKYNFFDSQSGPKRREGPVRKDTCPGPSVL